MHLGNELNQAKSVPTLTQGLRTLENVQTIMIIVKIAGRAQSILTERY